jgi:hypothetical protein
MPFAAPLPPPRPRPLLVARLTVSRQDAPGITVAIAGPNATVTLAAWVRRPAATASEGMIAGAWSEWACGRQFALFTNLSVCYALAPHAYGGGLAAHISNVGGPTPNHTFCYTAACAPTPLPDDTWVCLANVYNGTHIAAYVNGTLAPNGSANPFFYPGGIYSPEREGQPGSPFTVGANNVSTTPPACSTGTPRLSNQWTGWVGGVAVWDTAVQPSLMPTLCALPPLWA